LRRRIWWFTIHAYGSGKSVHRIHNVNIGYGVYEIYLYTDTTCGGHLIKILLVSIFGRWQLMVYTNMKRVRKYSTLWANYLNRNLNTAAACRDLKSVDAVLLLDRYIFELRTPCGIRFPRRVYSAKREGKSTVFQEPFEYAVF